MYRLEYWNAGAAEWRGAGCFSLDKAEVQRAMRNASEQCIHSVSFRIVCVPTKPLVVS